MFRTIDEFLVGCITFPLTNHLMNRRGVSRKYRALVRSDRSPAGELNEIQISNLRRVLTYAEEHCPYYTRRFHEAGLDPRRVQSVDDLRRLPPLGRQEVIENRREMVDARLAGSIDAAERSARGIGQPIPWARFRRHRLIRNTSTGSTGAPTIFYEDGSSTAMNWAHELRLKRWFGIGPGAAEARFARVSTEYLPRSRVLTLRKRLWHHLVLPGMNLSEADYELCFQRIRVFRPRVLFGITSALTNFADYLKRQDLAAHLGGIQLVITWAAPVYDHEKRLLESVFRAPVSNIYGSREVGHVACTCPEGRLHVNQEHYAVEIERPGGAGPGGGEGEILVTPLFQTPMPFIRYRIGDVGRWAGEPCPCGRAHLVLDNLLGRSGEVFRTGDGHVIAPNFWCRAFMGNGMSDAVERFQVVLRGNGAIRFRVLPRASYSPDTETLLRNYLRRNLPADTPLEFEYVPRIDPQPSGKYPMVIHEAATPNGSPRQP